jgi:uncharacterized protein (TIGR03084 family)
MAVIDDFEAEQDRLDLVLGGLDEDQWLAGSGAAGWSVTDVVLHLAQSEEAVAATISGTGLPSRPGGVNVDDAMDLLVRSQRAAPSAVLGRWRAARRSAVQALRSADPGQPMQWIEAPLKPATLATTRLAETWAHGLDITEALGIDWPDTGRLRHIAWLAHRSLAYAFVLAGSSPEAVFCRLTAPFGAEVWEFGPGDAPSRIEGPAGEFCRVAAQRLAPGESGLRAQGPHGATALRIVRTYAA